MAFYFLLFAFSWFFAFVSSCSLLDYELDQVWGCHVRLASGPCAHHREADLVRRCISWAFSLLTLRSVWRKATWTLLFRWWQLSLVSQCDGSKHPGLKYASFVLLFICFFPDSSFSSSFSYVVSMLGYTGTHGDLGAITEVLHTWKQLHIPQGANGKVPSDWQGQSHPLHRSVEARLVSFNRFIFPQLSH